MYLVHVQVDPPPSGRQPTATQVRASLAAAALRGDGLEHVSVHTPPGSAALVVGVYILAPSPADAETRAAALCRRALEGDSCWHGCRLRSVSVPTVTRAYEQTLRADPGRGRRGSGPLASS